MPQLAFNPYVSQYVPAPIDEFQRAAQHFQTEYDENMLASEKLKTMANSIKTLPTDRSLLLSEIKQYQDGLGEISKAGNYEDAGLKIRNLATDFAGNYQSGKIGQLAGSYTNYQQYLAEKQKLGNEYAAWNDDYLAYQRRGNKNEDGSYRPYIFNGLGKQEDHAKRADEVLGKLAEDGSITSGLTLSPDGTSYLVGKNGSEGVGMQKLRSVANAKASIFNDTVEGKDYLKKMSYQLGRNLSPQEQHDLSADYLLRTGMNQLGIKTTSEQDIKFLPKHLLKKEEDNQEIDATTAYSDATGNPLAVNAAAELANYESDGKGGLVKVEVGTTGSGVNLGVGSMGGSAYTKVRKPIDANDVVGQNLQKTILPQLRQNAALSDASGKRPRRVADDATLLAEYQQAMKNHQNVYIPSKTFNVQMQAQKAKQLSPTGDPLDMFSGRKVTLLDVKEKGGGKPGSAIKDIENDELQSLLKDRNTKVSVMRRSLINAHGMPGAYEVTVTNHGSGKGEVKNFHLLVQASPEEEQAMDLVAKVGNAAYSGAPQTDIDLGVQTNGSHRYLRVVNDPRGGKFKQRVESIELHKGTGIPRVLGTSTLDEAVQDLYKNHSATQLKKLRLASDAQGNAKGEEKDNNISDDEDDE